MKCFSSLHQFFLLICLCIVFVGCSKNSAASLPPKIAILPGSDPYQWMEQLDSAAMLKHLNQENLYAEAYFREETSMRDELIREFRAHSPSVDTKERLQVGDYEYGVRQEEPGVAPLIFRHKSNETTEEIILDLSAGLELPELRLLALKIAPDNRYITYIISPHPAKPNLLYVRDLENRRNFRVAEGVQTAQILNSGLLFFTTTNSLGRADRVVCSKAPFKEGSLTTVYSEESPDFYLRLQDSKDGEQLFISSESLESNSLLLVKRENGCNDAKLLYPAKDSTRHYGFSWGPKVAIQEINTSTETLHSVNLHSGSLNALAQDSATLLWKRSDPSESITEIQAFDKFLVVNLVKQGQLIVRIFSLDGKSHEIAAPDPLADLKLLANPDPHLSSARVSWSSFHNPETRALLNLNSGTLDKIKRTTLSRYDPDQFLEEKLEAPSFDGTKVPLIVVRSKDYEAQAPLLLQAYGAYGSRVAHELSAERVSLFTRGVNFAVCETRGGGYFGAAWREAGRKLNKLNSIADLKACAERLIERGIVARGKIFADGRSAGGLLVAALLNQDPTLFGGVILDRPFLDPLRVLGDKDLPLSARDIEEWGDPADPRVAKYLQAYSPYQNISAQSYPPILLLASLSDRAVQPWEAAKWAAKVRQLNVSNNPVLLHTDFSADHSGPAANYRKLEEIAMKYLFILRAQP